MFTGSNKDYQIVRHYQAQRRREADAWRLAHAARDDGEPSENNWRWMLRVVVIALLLVAILLGAQHVSALSPQPIRVDAGGPPEPFAEAMIAYREDLYELKQREYQQAVEKLTAIKRTLPLLDDTSKIRS